MPAQRESLERMNPERTKDPAAVSIFAVIVLYKMRPLESVTLRTLLEAQSAVNCSAFNLCTMIADNTPGGQPVDDLPPEVRYQAFPHNPGLVEPYNVAIAHAKREGFDWLLTLDQDTNLPRSYLADLFRHATLYATHDRVAGIVPRIVDHGTPISPIHFAGGFFPRVLQGAVQGLLPRHCSAINSASLLRIAALEHVGGYDSSFPLNNSDTALFHRLDAAGYVLAICGDTVVQHELAIMRRADRMTPERYRQLLLDERRFWDTHMGVPGRIERLIRLAGRLLKGIVRLEETAFRRATLDEIKARLFTRRATRLKRDSPGSVH